MTWMSLTELAGIILKIWDGLPENIWLGLPSTVTWKLEEPLTVMLSWPSTVTIGTLRSISRTVVVLESTSSATL